MAVQINTTKLSSVETTSSPNKQSFYVIGVEDNVYKKSLIDDIPISTEISEKFDLVNQSISTLESEKGDKTEIDSLKGVVGTDGGDSTSSTGLFSLVYTNKENIEAHKTESDEKYATKEFVGTKGENYESSTGMYADIVKNAEDIKNIYVATNYTRYEGTDNNTYTIHYESVLNPSPLDGIRASTINAYLPVSTDISGFCSASTASSINIFAPLATDCSLLFSNCNNITNSSIVLDSALSLDSMYLNCGSIISINVSAQRATSAESAFMNCVGLTNLILDVPLLQNGNSMCCGDSSLTAIQASLQNVTTMISAFENCTSIQSLSLNLNSLTNGTSMCSGCSSLVNFKFNEQNSEMASLVTLDKAFDGCTNLSTESCQNIVSTIPSYLDPLEPDSHKLGVVGVTNWTESMTLEVEAKGWSVISTENIA